MVQDILTGGTGGLGFEACRVLLKHGLSGPCIFDIRVNSLSPGYMETRLTKLVADSDDRNFKIWEDRIPMGRLGDPSELAGAIILLCSPAGRYITGTDIIVDGGTHVF